MLGEALAAATATPPAARPAGVSIHVLTKAAVVGRLRRRPAASFLIWAESVADASSSSSSSSSAAGAEPTTPAATDATTVGSMAMVSVKLNGAIWHEPLELPIKIRCSQQGKAQVCKADSKTLAQVRRLQNEFMPRLQALIAAIVACRNYVESDMVDEYEVRRELRFRKWLVFPCGCNQVAQFTLCKLNRHGGLELLAIPMNVRECSVSCVYQGRTLPITVESFHAILDIFLDQRWPANLTTSASSSKAESPEEKRRDTMAEKAELISSLRALLPHHGTIAETLVCDAALLSAIGELGKMMHEAPNDRKRWVNKGALLLLVKACCLLADDTSKTIAKLCAFLVEEDADSCYDLCNMLSVHLEAHLECPAVAALLEAMCKLRLFSETAQANACVSMLRDIHFRTLVEIFGSRAITCLGHLNKASSAAAPRLLQGCFETLDPSGSPAPESSEEIFLETVDGLEFPSELLPPEDKRTWSAPTGGAAAAGSEGGGGGSKIAIPRLRLPTKTDKGASSAHPMARGKGLGILHTLTDRDGDASARKELVQFSTKLGQYYATLDMPMLLHYKQRIDVTRLAPGRDLSSKLSLSPHRFDTDELQFNPRKDSKAAKVRCHILQAIANLSAASPEPLHCIPVSLLYCDAILTFSDNLFRNDTQYQSALWAALKSNTRAVEKVFRSTWNKATELLTDSQKETFRKRVDNFLWRINSRIRSLLSNEKSSDQEMSVQLMILRGYLRNCPSRVMSLQSSDVCLESLLRVKGWIFQRNFPQRAEMEVLFWLQEALDAIATCNTFIPLSSYMLAVFLKRPETWKHAQDHITSVFLGQRIIAEVLAQTDGKHNLKVLRLGVLQHFDLIVDLINVQCSEHNLGVEEYGEATRHYHGQLNPVEQNLVDMFIKLRFLLNPSTGCAAQFLIHSDDPFEEYDVKREILLLVIKALSSPISPFVRKKAYIEAYASLAYVRFVKLYQSKPRSPEQTELCDLYLQILLAFAASKSEKAADKIFQLRVMDFAVRETMLEYDTKFEWTKYSSPEEQKPFFATGTLQHSTPQLQARSPEMLGRSCPGSPATELGTRSPVPRLREMPKLKLGRQSRSPTPSPPLAAERPVARASPPIPSLALSSLRPREDKTSPTGVAGHASGSGTALHVNPPPLLALDRDASQQELPQPQQQPSEGREISPTKPRQAVPKLKITPDLVRGMGLRRDDSSGSLNGSGERSSAQQAVTTGTTSSGHAAGHMTQLERQLGKNAKLQLQLDNKNPQPKLPFAHALSLALFLFITLTLAPILSLHEYQRLRTERLIYSNEKLHVDVLSFIICALLDHNGTLDPKYSDQFPLQNKKMNVPFILSLHLNHPRNQSVIPALFENLVRFGTPFVCLLKLLSKRFFDPTIYHDLVKIAAGAYGTVYRCHITFPPVEDQGRMVPVEDPRPVVVKLMKLPETIHDRCVIHDSFTEIVAMDRHKTDRRIAHLYDFGVDAENYWLVMKEYKTSLKQWRRKQPQRPLAQMLPLFFNVFSEVLEACQALVDYSINHYDIKCDNFLVHPLDESVSETEFWNPPSAAPTFYVCLTDFGESIVFGSEEEGYTTRNRGTEYIKSPEMLTIAYAGQKEREHFDRRKKVGCNSASDVWSIGCLFYELLTGDFLFFEEDWVCFFMRVTQPGQELLNREARKKLEDNPHLIDFLEAVLVRNPIHRPTLREVTARFRSMKATVLQELGAMEAQPQRSRSFGSVSSVPTMQPAPEQPLIDQRLLVPCVAVAPESVPEEMLRRPSVILPGLFLGGVEALSDLHHIEWDLRVTHVIDITSTQAASALVARFVVMSVHPEGFRVAVFPRVIDDAVGFVRSALLRNGRVLIVSNAGIAIGAAIAIGCVMSLQMIGFFEALTFVKDHRYVISLHPIAIDQLQRISFARLACQGISVADPSVWPLPQRTHFRCFCGNTQMSLGKPLPVARCETLKVCSCTFIDPSDCPHTGAGCSRFLEDFQRRFGYHATSVTWGFTTASNIRCGLQKLEQRTVLVRALKDVPSMWRARVREKRWKLYQCRICGFITHAVSTIEEPDVRVAVVANIDASLHGGGVRV